MSSLHRKPLTSGKRACLIAAGAAVLAIGNSVTPSMAAASPVPSRAHYQLPMNSGISYLPARVDLQNVPSGTWVNTGLQVTLPTAGTYALDLNVRTRLNGVPPFNVFIVGRLWNVTAGSALPNSERILHQIADHTGQGAGQIGNNRTAPISERITVTGPTTIRLDVQRNDANGRSNAAAVWIDANGRTSFRFNRIFNFS
ncbi:MAG: hypothetical protein ACRDOO_04940 [Actinomadura sp.]